MTNENLLNLILNDAKTIGEVVTTGAAWEIWMQVELMFLLKRNGISAAREVNYPKPYQSLRLDLLVRDRAGQYAIELKVESAVNAGRALLVKAQEDIVKIPNYIEPGTVRFVTAIGYSDQAREALREFAGNNPKIIYNETAPIGVMVATV